MTTVALIGLIGWLVIASLGAMWAVVKLVRYRLSLDEEERQRYVDYWLKRIPQFFYSLLLVGILAEFWPGLASFTFDLVEALS